MEQVWNRVRKIVFVMLTTLLITGVFPVAPAFSEVPPNVRIGIITASTSSQYIGASAVNFSVKGSYQVIDLAAIPGENLVGAPVEGESWQIYYLSSGLQIYQNGNPLKITTGPLVIKEIEHSSENSVSLDSYTSNGTSRSIAKKYRGNMEFRNNGSSITAINEITMDEYLCGVVPREMSNSWPMEALKAQALAARTYVVVNYNRRAVDGFNLLDTPADQAYGGRDCEGDNATRAVLETSGEIITYNGKPISAVYHSTSGGHTEDNENVWTGPASPYLRGKPDPYSSTRGLANWTYTTTIEEVTNKLIGAGAQIGPVKSLKLEKYGSGRVKTVIITDVNGNTISKTGSEFGKLFNPKLYTYIGNTSFMSNFFDVKTDQVSTPSFTVLNGTGQKATASGADLYAVSDDGTVANLNGEAADFYVLGAEGKSSFSKAASGSIVFEGHGWGHGVGMSQWGAYEMAAQGKSYEDIIKFYYTGVEIEN